MVLDPSHVSHCLCLVPATREYDSLIDISLVLTASYAKGPSRPQRSAEQTE